MNIIILGAPASGKGTQAQLITEKFNLFHLQTGQIARDLAKTDARIRELITSGKLIPHEEMTMYVLDFLSKQKPDLDGILFEGFPRFIPQYDALENFLKTKGKTINQVISLDISREEAVKRMSARRTCESCGRVYNLITNPPSVEEFCECGGKLIQRDDDKPEAIEVRFKYYDQNTKELIEYLDQKGKIIRVDAARPIGTVYSDLQKIMEGLNNV